MANYQHSGRYPWGGDESQLLKMLKENANFKVTKIVETKEGLKVEVAAITEENINQIIKALEYCANDDRSCKGEECPYFKNEHCLRDIMLDAVGCINQLNKDDKYHIYGHDELAREIDGLKRQNKELREELRIESNKSRMIEDLKEENQVLRDKLEHVVTEGHNLQYEVDALARYNKKLSTDRDSFAEHLTKLEDENDSLKHDVKAMAIVKKTLRERLEASEKSNEELKLRLRREVDMLSGKNHVLEDALVESDKENGALREKLKALEELKEKFGRAVVENDHLKYEIDAIATQNQALREKLSASEAEIDGLKTTLAVAKGVNAELQHELKNMPERNCMNCDPTTMAAAQNKALREKLSASEAKINKLRATLDVAAAANAELQRECRNMPAKNCVNCRHYDVCGVVAERRAKKANNYKPCSFWKKAEDK